ncbi:2,4'-dihydroxyacetophenone dioxygenase family protein (plasmid) [Agrobacterium leguminum]|uniref:2,4'-dihydroxyacetophenone dioxygenase family protein n=1 Tax=Agrobacterium leguminum TaxID=2792015 RepID=UPI0030CFEF2A
MNSQAAIKPPIFSLPQDELLTVNVSDVPLLKDSLAPGFHFQPLLLDPENALSVVITTTRAGTAVGAHLHTGAVHGYTLSGRWYYAEYPDQVQTAGSYLYEPACSKHSLVVPEDNTEDTVILFVLYGANIFLGPNDEVISILDAVTIQKLVETCSQRQGIDAVQYLKGGSAGYVLDRKKIAAG